jgi:hypothetical protein
VADMFGQVGALILKGAKPLDLPTARARHRGAAAIDRECRRRVPELQPCRSQLGTNRVSARGNSRPNSSVNESVVARKRPTMDLRMTVRLALWGYPLEPSIVATAPVL